MISFFVSRCVSCFPHEITWWRNEKFWVKKSNSWESSWSRRYPLNLWHPLWRLPVTQVLKILVAWPKKNNVTLDAWHPSIRYEPCLHICPQRRIKKKTTFKNDKIFNVHYLCYRYFYHLLAPVFQNVVRSFLHISAGLLLLLSFV